MSSHRESRKWLRLSCVSRNRIIGQDKRWEKYLKAKDMPSQRLIYCTDCGYELEKVGEHRNHKLDVRAMYETVGQEILAAHDAVTSGVNNNRTISLNSKPDVLGNVS
jgi:hypothetical protein